MTENLTRDAFLGGRLHLWQPRDGYRAGIDSVLLAAGVSAISGQSILDLGCGVGAASLCLATRVKGLSITGVDRQAEYVHLARRNSSEADIPMDIIEADIAKLPAESRKNQFDHVIANPPYFKKGCRKVAANSSKEVALSESTSLQVWLEVAARRIVPKGYFFLIHRSERLPDLLRALPRKMGSVEIRPIAPRFGKSANLILMRARKGGRSPFRLHTPLVLHEGEKHTHDAESFCDDAQDILRRGEALVWPRYTDT